MFLVKTLDFLQISNQSSQSSPTSSFSGILAAPPHQGFLAHWPPPPSISVPISSLDSPWTHSPPHGASLSLHGAAPPPPMFSLPASSAASEWTPHAASPPPRIVHVTPPPSAPPLVASMHLATPPRELLCSPPRRPPIEHPVSPPVLAHSLWRAHPFLILLILFASGL